MFLPFPRSLCDQLKRVWFKTAPKITLTSPFTSPHPSALFRCGQELGALLWSKQALLADFHRSGWRAESVLILRVEASHTGSLKVTLSRRSAAPQL